MTHLSLYIAVCRDLLEPNSPLELPTDEGWEESARRIRKLRQLLLCRVCKTLSADPYHSGNCQHLICKGCKDGRKSHFPGCRACKKSEGLIVDKQAVSILSCYGKLCEILYSHGISGEDNLRSKRIREIWNLVVEGAQLASYLREKDLLGLADRPIDAERGSHSGSKHEPSHLDDVSQQNNAIKDGGSNNNGEHNKDGRLDQDGGLDEYGATVTTAKGEVVEENLETINETMVVWKEEKQAFNSDGIDRYDTAKTGKIEAMNEEKPTAPDLGEKSEYEDNAVVKSEDVTNGERDPFQDTCIISVDDCTLENRFDLLKNGVIKPSFLLEKDVNRAPDTTNKRKLRISTSTDDKKNIISLKTKKKKMVKNDSYGKHQESRLKVSDDKLNNIVESAANCEAESLSDKETKHQIGNLKATAKEAVETRSNGYKKIGFESKDARKSCENSSVTKTKLYRKNKYKCSCGSSGSKYFSDICKHRRCACFVAEVPCTNCKCRFCSNPYKASDKLWSSFSKGPKNEAMLDDDNCANHEITT